MLAKDNIVVLKTEGDFVKRFLTTYKSKNTCDDYRRYILEFFQVKNTHEVTINMVQTVRVIHAQDYIGEVINKGLSYSSVNGRKSALSSLWKYVIDTYEGEVITLNPWNNITLKKMLKNNFEKKDNFSKERILTKEEIDKLLTNIRDTRDNVLIKTMLNTGIRGTEIGGIKWNDFFLVNNEWYLRIRADIAKGRKEREVFVNEDLIESLKKWGGILATIGETDDEVFGLHRKSVNRIVKKHVTEILNYNDVHAHTLRHNNLTHLAMAGVDPKDLQYHAGHSDIQTTMNYINLVNKYQNSAGKAVNF